MSGATPLLLYTPPVLVSDLEINFLCETKIMPSISSNSYLNLVTSESPDTLKKKSSRHVSCLYCSRFDPQKLASRVILEQILPFRWLHVLKSAAVISSCHGSHKTDNLRRIVSVENPLYIAGQKKQLTTVFAQLSLPHPPVFAVILPFPRLAS